MRLLRALSSRNRILLAATAVPALAALLLIAVLVSPGVARPSFQERASQLSASEFSALSRRLSEEGGYFHSDNFTSNETSYLHIVDRLHELAEPGGAYLGVGPEQNYTYIAKVRPAIAFLLDIRRQAVIQHLMFKALFELSPTRAEFLQRLLSLPQAGKLPGREAPVPELLDFAGRQGDDAAFKANLALVQSTIEKDFNFPLSERDRTSLAFVYGTFRSQGLKIAYRPGGAWGSYFPTLQDLIAATDLNGNYGNFLAVPADYEFVRSLHRRNLIIPVVGDFGGTQALAAVAGYLKRSGYRVSAFYTSNVERYLFGDDSFPAFARNVKQLPIDDRSLFIRAVAGGSAHPERRPGHRSTTLLQKISVFVEDFDAGRYQSYRDLVMTHYIAAR